MFTFRQILNKYMFLVDEATGLTNVESSWFESQQVHAIFLFSNTFRSAQGATDSPIQRVPVDFSRQVKRPRSETDNLPTASLPLTLNGIPKIKFNFLFVISCSSLVNDTVSSSVYTVSNDWVIMKRISCGR